MRTALVIEDQRPVRESLGDLLRLADLRVKLVGDGGAAEAELQARAYDLVTLDLNMPSLDGVSLLESVIEQGGPNRDTPVIVISAYLTDELKDGLRGLGVRHFFPKPFEADRLLETVHRLLPPD